MDPTLAVAFVSIITALVTTSGGVLIALVTNRKEAENAAVRAAENAEERAEGAKHEALEALIRLRDEQVENLANRNERLQSDNDRLRSENDRLRADKWKA